MQTYPTTSLPLLSSDTFDGMTRTERLDYLKRATELERRFNRTRLSRYRPYPKQAEFHAAGATHRERLFMAGNRVGKTQCGAPKNRRCISSKRRGGMSSKRVGPPVPAPPI